MTTVNDEARNKDATELVRKFRANIEGKPQHYFPYMEPDCLFCGAFGPLDEDDPCQRIYTGHQVAEIRGALQELVDRRAKAVSQLGGNPDGSDGRYARARKALES